MKILIVDDSSTMRRILTTRLQVALVALDEHTLEILEAENGQEGLDILQDNLDVDFVFLDVNMPIMNGDKMLYIMRNSADLLNIKVVMQTTEGVRGIVKKLAAMGVSGYLLKPYTQEIVTTLMLKLLKPKVSTA